MNYTMLVVDDVKMNRSILKAIFEKEYDIIEAESGEETLEILQVCAGNIDIILLDIMMPGMSGIELLETYRKESYMANIPVVVITASERMEDQLEAFQVGANGFIVKPFMREIVSTRVKNVLASSKKILEMQREREVLKTQSEMDQMTGMYNKITGQAMISNELSLYPRGIHALMMVDIDNFKSVNDNEGHLAGDQTIKIIANQIMALFRKSDVMVRFGGDEFCVFMSNLLNMEIARKKAQELAVLLKYKPNLTIPANVSVSVGLTFSNREDASYDTLLKQADEALYKAKEAGKARVVEHGENISKSETIDQEIVLLISRNRNVCSNVHAAFGISNVVVECGTLDGIDHMKDILQRRLILSIVDLSEEDDNGVLLLTEIADRFPWILANSFLCPYKEGNMKQVKAAIQAGATDILPIPFELKTIQRAIERYIKDEGAELS